MRIKLPQHFIRFLGPIFGLIVLIVVIFILQKQIRHLTLSAIYTHITDLPRDSLLLALFFNLCAYLALCGYDLLGVQYIRAKIPWYKTAFASILSYIFSNNIGMSIVGASAIRLRFYPTWGIKTFSIFQLVLFTSVTMWLGIFTISGISFLVIPIDLPPNIPIPTHAVRPVGLILLFIVFLYMIFCASYRNSIRLPGKISFKLPRLRIALIQPIIGVIDYSLAAMVFYTLLPNHSEMHYPIILTIFLLAQISGMISHVPGGLGVFDAVAFLMLSQYYEPNVALSCIILFRVIYFILPLIVGGITLLLYEVTHLIIHPKT